MSSATKAARSASVHIYAVHADDAPYRCVTGVSWVMDVGEMTIGGNTFCAESGIELGGDLETPTRSSEATPWRPMLRHDGSRSLTNVRTQFRPCAISLRAGSGTMIGSRSGRVPTVLKDAPDEHRAELLEWRGDAARCLNRNDDGEKDALQAAELGRTTLLRPFVPPNERMKTGRRSEPPALRFERVTTDRLQT